MMAEMSETKSLHFTLSCEHKVSLFPILISNDLSQIISAHCIWSVNEDAWGCLRIEIEMHSSAEQKVGISFPTQTGSLRLTN